MLGLGCRAACSSLWQKAATPMYTLLGPQGWQTPWMAFWLDEVLLAASAASAVTLLPWICMSFSWM
jgi:hypothetical protein